VVPRIDLDELHGPAKNHRGASGWHPVGLYGAALSRQRWEPRDASWVVRICQGRAYPANRVIVAWCTRKVLAILAATFSGFEPGDRLTLLMAIELGFAAEFGASRPRWRA
jgi:hypothetical protein